MAANTGVSPEVLNERVEQVGRVIAGLFPGKTFSEAVLNGILKEALASERLLDDLAELFRTSRDEVAKGLAGLGLPVAGGKKAVAAAGGGAAGWTAAPGGLGDTLGLEIWADSPEIGAPLAMDGAGLERLSREWDVVVDKVKGNDPFLEYYRVGVREYFAYYMEEVSPRIHDFIDDKFGPSGPTYVVTGGIGANEQFWHYPRQLHCFDGLTPAWIVVDNPKDIAKLPADCTTSNTLFMEFSRSGKTQETLKFHEFMKPGAAKIVFANSGPLRELADREGVDCLCLELPDQVPGRFGKNLTPIFLAPMDVLGRPIREYWDHILRCIDTWDLTDPNSPPAAIARYIRGAQLAGGRNHIYFGCNDEMLIGSCDELVQFWNEGVNKGGNDLLMSRYFGLPRDSHLNIEGVLSNAATKLGLFLLRRGGERLFDHPLVNPNPDFLNPGHKGLTIAEVDYRLGKANAEHFASKMPTVVVEVTDPDFMTSATLSQLWTDVVYCYSLMIGVNPGSNPEVKYVRDRSEKLLAG